MPGAADTMPSWPMTREGELDWEAVFEAPDTGLIAVVEQAKSRRALKDCARTVIRLLFLREVDAERREAFETLLDELVDEKTPLGDHADTVVGEAKQKVVWVLRQIKRDRTERAASGAQAEGDDGTAADDGDGDGERRSGAFTPEPDADVRMTEAERGTPDHVGSGDSPSTSLFADIFCGQLRERFDALQSGIAQDRPDGDRLPFILSAEFVEHFERLLRSHFAPALLTPCRGLVTPADAEPAETRRCFLEESMNERKNRAVLWEAWQTVWKDLTLVKEKPPKPKEEPKKGLLGALRKKDDQPAWKRSLTPEEWEAACREIDATNERARGIWAEIAEDAPGYEPPTEADNGLLLELLGRSPAGMGKHITALHQIATQGGSPAKAFDSYQKGKNIDLMLLAASYQFPDAFLGKRAMLRNFLKGYTETQRRQQFALVSRFLSEHI